MPKLTQDDPIKLAILEGLLDEVQKRIKISQAIERALYPNGKPKSIQPSVDDLQKIPTLEQFQLHATDMKLGLRPEIRHFRPPFSRKSGS